MNINEIKYTYTVPKILDKFYNTKILKALDKEFKRDAKCAEGVLTEKCAAILKGIVFENDQDVALNMGFTEEKELSVYLAMPRGIKLEISNMKFTADTRIQLTNVFNIYDGEGFTLCLSDKEGNAIVIEPAARGGIKGDFCVDVYGMDAADRMNVVIADMANFADVSNVLKFYRG